MFRKNLLRFNRIWHSGKHILKPKKKAARYRVNSLHSQELREILLPVKRRLFLIHLVKMLVRGLALGLLLNLLFSTAARFFLLRQDTVIHAFFVVLGLGAGVLGAYFTRPDFYQAALAADDFGLKERMVTAVEFDGSEHPWPLQQRADAVKRARAIPLKQIKLTISKQAAAWVLLLTVATLFSAVLPNPMQEVAARKQREHQQVKEQAKQVQQLIGELGGTGQLSDSELARLRRLVAQLDQADSVYDAVKELSAARQDLAEIARQERRLVAENMAPTLSQHPQTASLGKAVSSQAASNIRSAAAELGAALEGKSLAEKQAVAGVLAEAASELPAPLNDQALKAAGFIAASGREASGAAALGSALAQGTANDVQAGAAAAALEQAKMNLTGAARVAGQIGATGQTSGGEGSSGQQGSGPSGQQGAGGAGGGQSSGTQAGGSPGQGTSGSGGGQGGGAGLGAGVQHGQGGNAGGGQIGAGRQGQPSAEMAEYEPVFAPMERIGTAGAATSVPGRRQNGAGGEYIEVRLTPEAVDDATVPYMQVLGHYSAQARRNVDRAEIPPQLRSMVKEYFTSLE